MSKNEEFKIDSVPDLIARITKLWRSKENEAITLQAEQKEKLKTEIRNEKTITAQLEKQRKIAAQLEKEYMGIEKKTEAEAKTRVSKGILRESDVRSGKITLKEFQAKGRYDKDLTEEAAEQSTEELEKTLKVVRGEYLEILELEKSLCESQNIIRSLILQPAMILQQVLKDCKEITEQEIGLFLADNYGNRSALELAKHKLLLTQGKSLTPGYNWDRMPTEEARKLIFNPIIPLDLVPLLKAELEKVKGSLEVAVSFYLRSRDFMIRPFGGTFKSRRGPVRSEEKNEKKD